MRILKGHERDPEKWISGFPNRSHTGKDLAGWLFKQKDIPLTTSVIQRRVALRAIPHERVSGA
jgi:hypothetical protein